MSYGVYDINNENIIESSFSTRENAKTKRDELNTDYYGKKYYKSIIYENKYPRYVVIRTKDHPNGPSNNDFFKVKPAEPPKKQEKTEKKEKDKILNKNKGKKKKKNE